MLIKLTITTEVFVDLRALPFKEWPAEAQSCARSLLGQPRTLRKFLLELPALRKDWLAARIELMSKGLLMEVPA